MVYRIYRLLKTKEHVIVIKKTKFLLYLLGEAFVISLLLKHEMLIGLMNNLIGVLLVYTAGAFLIIINVINIIVLVYKKMK